MLGLVLCAQPLTRPLPLLSSELGSLPPVRYCISFVTAALEKNEAFRTPTMWLIIAKVCWCCALLCDIISRLIIYHVLPSAT